MDKQVKNDEVCLVDITKKEKEEPLFVIERKGVSNRIFRSNRKQCKFCRSYISGKCNKKNTSIKENKRRACKSFSLDQIKETQERIYKTKMEERYPIPVRKNTQAYYDKVFSEEKERKQHKVKSNENSSNQ